MPPKLVKWVPPKDWGQKKPLWVRDEQFTECFACHQPFSVFRRKHHCRLCGGLYCAYCLQKINYPKLYKEPELVCVICLKRLEQRKKQALQKSSSVSDYTNLQNSNNNNKVIAQTLSHNNIAIYGSNEGRIQPTSSSPSIETLPMEILHSIEEKSSKLSSYDDHEMLFESSNKKNETHRRRHSSAISGQNSAYQSQNIMLEGLTIIKSNSLQVENKFFLACFSAELEDIKNIVKIYPDSLDVHAVDEYELDNAVLRACLRQTNTLSVLKYLIEDLKISYQYTNKRGHSVIHKLCMANPYLSLDAIRWFIEVFKMDINVVDHSGRTALFYLVENRNRFTEDVIPILHYLINQGISITHEDDKGENCLQHGCGVGNASLDVIEALLDTGIDINAQSGIDKYSALMHLIKYNNSPSRVALTKLLIQRGADINLSDTYGNTAFLIACGTESKLELAQFLYHEGADIYKKNKENLSALDIAYQSPAVLIWLLCIGAHYHLNQMSLNQLLITAASSPVGIRLESLIALVQEGADIHFTSNGKNLLHLCCENPKTTQEITIIWLVEQGINVNATTYEGMTACHILVDIPSSSLLNENNHSHPQQQPPNNNNNIININNNVTHTLSKSKEFLLRYLWREAGADLNIKDSKARTVKLLASRNYPTNSILLKLLSFSSSAEALQKDDFKASYTQWLRDTHKLKDQAAKEYDRLILNYSPFRRSSELADADVITNDANRGVLSASTLIHSANTPTPLTPNSRRAKGAASGGSGNGNGGASPLPMMNDMVNSKIRRRTQMYSIAKTEIEEEFLRLCSTYCNDLNSLKLHYQSLLEDSELALSSSSSSVNLNTNVVDRRGRNALALCFMEGKFVSLMVVQWMINELKIDIHGVDIEGKSLLMYAISSSVDLPIIKYLIEKDISVNTFDQTNRTALHYACEVNPPDYNIIEILLKESIDVNARANSNTRYPLLAAVQSSTDTEIFRLLIEHGADLYAVDALGNNCYLLSCKEGKLANAVWFIQQGISIASLNRMSENALIVAMRSVLSRQYEMIKWLIDSGVDINATSKDGISPLLALVGCEGRWRVEDTDILMLLSQSDHQTLNIKQVDNEGENALHKACGVKSAHKVPVVWLVNHGIDINAVNHHGQTAAHKLISWNRSRERLQILRYLIYKGANLDTQFHINVKSVKELANELHKTWKELLDLINDADEIQKTMNDILEIGRSGILSPSHFSCFELFHWFSQTEWEIQNGNSNRKYKIQSILWFKLKSKEQHALLSSIMFHDSDHFHLLYSLSQLSQPDSLPPQNKRLSSSSSSSSQPLSSSSLISSSPPPGGVFNKLNSSSNFNNINYNINNNNNNIISLSSSPSGQQGGDVNKLMRKLTDRFMTSSQKLPTFSSSSASINKVNMNNGEAADDHHYYHHPHHHIDDEGEEGEVDTMMMTSYAQIYQSKLATFGQTDDHQRIAQEVREYYHVAAYSTEQFDFIQKARYASLGELKLFHSRMNNKGGFSNSHKLMIDHYGNTPLHLACGYQSARNIDVIRWLVEDVHIPINSKNKESETCFSLAIQFSSYEIIEYLLEHGASPQSFHYKYFYNIIHYACLRKHHSSSLHINNNNNNNNNNININIKNNKNNKIIKEEEKKRMMIMMEKEKKEEYLKVMNLMLENIDSQIVDVNGLATAYQLTPLLLLIQQGNYDEEIIDQLVAKGGYIHAIDAVGNNVLHYACSSGNIEIVKFIYEKYKINIPNSINHDGRTLLHTASQTNNLELVKYVMNNGAPLNAIDRSGYSAFSLCIKACSSLEIARYLMAISGNEVINQLSFLLETPLHLACGEGGGDGVMVKWLVELGVDINFQNVNGLTAAHYCVQPSCGTMKHQKCLRYLYSKGANFQLKDKEGLTVLDMALKYHKSNKTLLWHVRNPTPLSKDDEFLYPEEVAQIKNKKMKEEERINEEMKKELVSVTIYFVKLIAKIIIILVILVGIYDQLSSYIFPLEGEDPTTII